MPSVIQDFLEPIKKMSSEVLIANNQSNNEVSYNIIKNNVYKKTITINNTGKAAKSNYIISFVIDHLNLWKDNKSAFNFCDLRVFDSNGTTILSHEVQSHCTSYCLVSVIIPTINSNSNKDIYIEYGNPALVNTSQNIWGSIYKSSNLLAHYRANEANKTIGGGLLNNQEVTTLQNIVKNSKIMIQNNGVQAPIFVTNQLNGLPVMRFDGIDDYLAPTTVESSLDNLTEFSLFFVAKANSIANYQSLIRYQNSGGSNFTVFPFNDGKLILSADGGTAGGVQLNPTVNQFCLGNGNWKKNTTSGFNTYLNSVLQNQRTSANANNNSQRLGIGSFSDGNSNFFNGDIAEILIFNRSLAAFERQQIEIYLNTKYRIYNTSDMPTITVSNESLIISNFNYTSYASIANWTSNSNLSNNLFCLQETKSKINVLNLFESTLLAGVNQENWNNSSLYYNDQEYLSSIILAFSRTNTITTSVLIDSCAFDAVDTNNSNLNINRLDNFCLYNEIQNNYLLYPSTDEDYISLEFSADDVNNLNLNSSYLRFQSLSNSTTFTANLNLNETTLENNISNKIRIKKLLFTKVGPGDWSNMITFRCNFQTLTGTNKVYYGNLQLIQNIESKKEYKKGQKVKLANSVSSDNGLTYYTQSVSNAIINSQSIEDTISMSCIDYLDLVKDLKMSDLQSWSGDAITFNSQLELSSFVPNHKIKFFTYFVQKLLGFVFPNNLLDINLDLLSIEDASTDVVSLNYFNIREDEKFGDVLQELLNSCAATIAWDSINNKFICRNIYKNLDTTVYSSSGLQLQTPFLISSDLIEEYTEDTRSSDYIYNYVKLTAVTDNYFEKRGIIEDDSLNYRLNASSFTTIFLEFNKENYYFCSNLQVGAWFTSNVTNSDAYDNSNIIVDSVFYADKNIGITFINTSSTKFLRKVEIIADVLIYSNIETYLGISAINKSEFNHIIQDTNSINRNKKKEYELSLKYQYVSFDPIANNGNLKVANFYQAIVNNLKESNQILSIKLNYLPNLRLGQVIKIRDKTGKVITAFVFEIDQNSSPPDFDTTIKIIAIK